MPKILITGNGFDLSFGLPTSYNDFITILNKIDENQLTFESIYSKTSTYSQIIENYNQFNFDALNIELLKGHIKTNIWYQFFKNEFEIDTWIDFENKIEYVLKILFSTIDYMKKNIFSNGSLSNEIIKYNPSVFNNNIEIIQVLKIFGIINYDKNQHITLNSYYLIKKYDHFIDIDLDKITKKLYYELNDFKKIFNFYFEIFIYPFYDNSKLKIDRSLFITITKHYTFNFTPTYEKMYRKNNITSFLHGRIDSSLNQIVLGINEIPNESLDKKYFLPFTKYFQKLNNNTDYNFLQEYDKKQNSNYMFFFLGHSLDQSDEDYINEVFDFINKIKSRIKKIVIIYHNENSKSKLLINLLNIRGKNDIQNLMRNNVLIFTKIDSIELKQELKKEINTSSSDLIR